MARYGSLVRLIIIVLIAVIIFVYVIFNSRFIMGGPIIEIYDLKNGQIIEGDGLIEIKGKAKNTSFISLNGRTIYIDEKNEFNEKILLSNQINKIEIYAKDKFGKEIRKNIILVYNRTPIPLPQIKTDVEEATTTEEILENP